MEFTVLNSSLSFLEISCRDLTLFCLFWLFSRSKHLKTWLPTQPSELMPFPFAFAWLMPCTQSDILTASVCFHHGNHVPKFWVGKCAASKRVRQIELRDSVREWVKQDIVKVLYIADRINPSDIFTKERCVMVHTVASYVTHSWVRYHFLSMNPSCFFIRNVTLLFQSLIIWLIIGWSHLLLRYPLTLTMAILWYLTC